MKPVNFVSALKEFFLEILGYLLPGLSIFFLLSLVLKEEVKEYFAFLLQNEYSLWTVIGLSYVLGYILFGVSLLTEKVFLVVWNPYNKLLKWLKQKIKWLHSLLRFMSFNNSTELNKSIKESPEFKLSKQILGTLLNSNEKFTFDTNDMTVSQVRNLAMSYVPHVNDKIYIFMFRSELANHIGNAVMIFGLIGIIECIGNFSLALKTTYPYIGFYLLMIPISAFLHQNKDEVLEYCKKNSFSSFHIILL